MSIVQKTALQTPTITAGAYSIGDALGGKISFLVGSSSSGYESAVVQSITLIDLAKQSADIDLVLFGADFTATADGDAFDPSDADLANCIGHISITADDYSLFNDNAVATLRGVGLVFQSGSLYGQLVLRSAPTYASTSDIKIQIGYIEG